MLGLGRLRDAWHERRMRKMTERIDALGREIDASPKLTALFNQAVREARIAAPVIDRCKADILAGDMTIMFAGIVEYPEVSRIVILGDILLHKQKSGTTEGGLRRFIDNAIAAQKPCCKPT